MQNKEIIVFTGEKRAWENILTRNPWGGGEAKHLINVEPEALGLASQQNGAAARDPADWAERGPGVGAALLPGALATARPALGARDGATL